MVTSVQVIVSRYNGTSVYGNRLVDTFYPTVEAALSAAEPFRTNGVSVLVRPSYNEFDAKKSSKFYREWRSFNGEPLREIRWDIL